MGVTTDNLSHEIRHTSKMASVGEAAVEDTLNILV